MLTYATIFIASIILALIALMVYRVVMDSGKSVLNSKEPIIIISSTPNPRKGNAPFTTTGTPALSGEKSHVTPGRIAATHPAMPSEKIDWGWQTDGNHVREHHPHHGAGGGNTGHCSLYDVNPTATSNQSAARPHREEKLETGGKAYKVTREVTPQTSNDESSDKPWGW